MLKEQERWQIQALHRIGHSIRQIGQITCHARRTISNILAFPSCVPRQDEGNSDGRTPKKRRSGRRSALEPFRDLILKDIKHGGNTATLLLKLRGMGFKGSLRSLQRFIHAKNVIIFTEPQQIDDWMHLVLQGGKTSSQIMQDVGETFTDDDAGTLLGYVRTKPLKFRNRALALLAHGKGIAPGKIASFLCITRATVRQYISGFKEAGIDRVLSLSRKEVKKAADPKYTYPVFKTIHTPASAFGLNRTTWRMDDLYAVLIEQGVPISKANIRKIIKSAGYKFRKAKKVLTRTDPAYREKLQKITQILAHLKPDEKLP